MDLPVVSLVALEEESGKTTNGLGYMVADRGPRELLELASPEQVERYVMPVVRGETREAWAITEPGAGSDIKDIATTAERDGEGWVLNGEKWFVTGGERAGILYRAGVGRGGSGVLPRRQGRAWAADRAHADVHARPVRLQARRARAENCRVPDSARLGGEGNEGTKRWFSLEGS